MGDIVPKGGKGVWREPNFELFFPFFGYMIFMIDEN